MPFDPHLLRPEEPPLDKAGELQLPDDLVELAAQLRDDAAHLAATYPSRSLLPEGASPPPRESQERTARQARRTTWRLTRSIASVAVIAALAVSAGYWPQRRPNAPVEPQLSHAPSIVAEPAPVAPAPRATAPSPAPPAPASPALFLHDYSGPELEGLYDLLEEDEAAEPGTISI